MFNKRKNKSFNYKPRFSKETNIDTHTDENAESVDFVSKWKRQKGTNKSIIKGTLSVRTLILILVLLLICMYLLEKKIN